MRKIQLTQKELQEKYVFSEEHRTLLHRKNNKIVGCLFDKAKTNYLRTKIEGNPYLVHRLVYKYFHGDFDETLQIDHIDGNGTNNSVDNLRLVEQKENKKNKSKYSSNTSGVNGVHWQKTRKRWIARLQINNHRTYIGTYKDINKAKESIEEAKVRYGFHVNHGRG